MYRGGNIVVAAAGNLKHDELVGSLEKLQSEAGQGACPKARGCAARSSRPPRPSMRFRRKRTEQYHVCIGAPGIARSDRRRFTASVLDALLGGSASSRLFQEIREKRGMAYSVYTFASQYTDTGLIGFYVGTRSENLADCLEIANEQIAEVAAGKFRKSELERAKENLKGRILLSMESTSNADEPPREVDDLGRGAPLDRPDRRGDRRGLRPTRWPSSAACCWPPRSCPLWDRAE